MKKTATFPLIERELSFNLCCQILNLTTLSYKIPLFLSDDDYSLSDAPGSELYTNKPVHFSALPEIFLTPDSHGLVSVPSPPASM